MQYLGQNLHNRNITKVRQNESSNMPPLSVNRGALKFPVLTKRRNKDCNNNNNKNQAKNSNETKPRAVEKYIAVERL